MLNHKQLIDADVGARETLDKFGT